MERSRNARPTPRRARLSNQPWNRGGRVIATAGSQFRRAWIIGLLVWVTGLGVLRGQEATQASVEAWLALVDAQEYAESWRAAASLFRNAVTVENWQAAVKAARVPLGSVKSRTVKSVTSTTTLPGAP